MADLSPPVAALEHAVRTWLGRPDAKSAKQAYETMMMLVAEEEFTRHALGAEAEKLPLSVMAGLVAATKKLIPTSGLYINSSRGDCVPLLNAVLLHPDLTFGQGEDLVRAYLFQLLARSSKNRMLPGLRWPEGENREALTTLTKFLGSANCTYSTAGTVWRFLTLMGEPTPLLTQMLLAPRVPAPVVARMLAPNMNEASSKFGISQWHQRVDKQYPDLAGLPHDLKVDMLAGFPIRKEWFRDVVNLQKQAYWVAPGVQAHEAEAAMG